MENKMSQKDIKHTRASVDLILSEQWQRYSIEFLPGCCRVTSIDNYIKAEVFSKPDNKKFRVMIMIESISDEMENQHNG
jgi:hypothetical protein